MSSKRAAGSDDNPEAEPPSKKKPFLLSQTINLGPISTEVYLYFSLYSISNTLSESRFYDLRMLLS